MTEELLIGIASVLVLGIGAPWIAWRIKLPSILVLLTFGFLAGPLTGFLHVDGLLGDLLFPIVSLSVGVILFEGGLSLKFADLRHVRPSGQVGSVLRWEGILIDPASRRLSVFATDGTLTPQPGQTIVSLVHPEPRKPEPEKEQAVSA